MANKTDKPEAAYDRRKKFAKTFQFIREEFLKLEIEEFPGDGSRQRDIESDSKQNIPDFEYFFRVLIFLAKQNELQKNVENKAGENIAPLLTHLQLNLLLILNLLAKCEVVEEHKSFQDFAYSDDSGEELPKYNSKEFKGYPERYETYKNQFAEEVKNFFPVHWQKYGEGIREYFFSALLPLAQDLEVKMLNELKVLKLEETSRIRKKHLPPTLEMFPFGFRNLKIIVGGYSVKRMKEPESIGDLFRESQSFTNLHYLLNIPGLTPDTEIISDQLLLEMEERERQDLLAESDLLIVGTPIVNYVNRHLILNNMLICNAILHPEAYDLKKELGNNFHDGLKIRLGEKGTKLFATLINTDAKKYKEKNFDHRELDEETIEKVWTIVSQLRKIVRKPKATTEEFINFFRQIASFSPLLEKHFTWDIYDHNHEYAVISPGRHPWSEKDQTGNPQRSLISVFGNNKVSTAMALKELTNRRKLAQFPLGGIMEIEKQTNKGIRSVVESSVRWIPNDISLAELQPLLDRTAASKRSALPVPFDQFSKDNFEEYKIFVESHLESHRVLHPEDFERKRSH